MRTLEILNRPAQGWIFVMCLILPLQSRAEQFVELTAEIEVNHWDYWFLIDSIPGHPERQKPSSVFTPSRTVRFVVSTNRWMMQSEYGNQLSTRWFTGTQIIWQTVATNTLDMNSAHQYEGRRGVLDTRVDDSADGNPGRPVRVADLMPFDTAAKVGWLAFCSGSALKRDGRTIFPPSDLWKEYYLGSDWSDKTSVFHDTLGLPESITLLSTNHQSIFQYQVHQSTNVLGWNFPLEFYGVQYLPNHTNGWQVHLTIKGRVKAIGIGTEPLIPAEVIKAVKK